MSRAVRKSSLHFLPPIGPMSHDRPSGFQNMPGRDAGSEWKIQLYPIPPFLEEVLRGTFPKKRAGQRKKEPTGGEGRGSEVWRGVADREGMPILAKQSQSFLEVR